MSFQLSQSRTQPSSQNESTVSSTQQVAAVDFSLYSPQKPSTTNQNTLVESSSNQSTPPRTRSANPNSFTGLNNQNEQLGFPASQSTPPRQSRSANQNSPSRLAANEISPVQKQPMGHEHLFSPGRESVVSHSTEKDPEEVTIENAALGHLKQFQDYINK